MTSFEYITKNIYHPNVKKRKIPVEKCSCTLLCDKHCINKMMFIECDSNCQCGKYCLNQQFKKYKKVNLGIIQTHNRGRCVIALQFIKKNTLVCEFIGEIIDIKEFNRRLKMQKNYKNNYYYVILEDNEEDLIIDSTYKGNIARFINHSCDPNCELQTWIVDGEKRVGFFAIKDIEKYTEITYNYNFIAYDKNAIRKCFCGSKNCKGVIGKINSK